MSNTRKKIRWVQGNTQSVAIPLEEEVQEASIAGYVPPEGSVIKVRLSNRFQKFDYVPTSIDGSVLTITDDAQIPAGEYGIEVFVTEPDGTKRHSFWNNVICVTPTNDGVLQEFDEFLQPETLTVDPCVFYFAKGASAYDIAVAHGYTGTEEEYNAIVFDAHSDASDAREKAAEALRISNVADGKSVEAVRIANVADGKSDEAKEIAAGAVSTANKAERIANNASDKSDNAVAAAGRAEGASGQAVETANTAAHDASDALSNSRDAVETAGNAMSTVRATQTQLDNLEQAMDNVKLIEVDNILNI